MKTDFFIPRHTIVVGIMVSRWMSVCLSVRASVRPSRFSFLDDNLSKLQWIFTKLGMCIDIVEVWLGLLMGKFRQFLTELSAQDTPIFSFPGDNLSK